MTGMDRRSFLRLLAAAVIAPALPAEAGMVPVSVGDVVVGYVPASPDSRGELGHTIEYRIGAIPVAERAAFQEGLARELVTMARAALPQGQRFDIRARIPRDYGRSHGIAWYTNATMQSDPEWMPADIRPGVYLPSEGYYHIASLVA